MAQRKITAALLKAGYNVRESTVAGEVYIDYRGGGCPHYHVSIWWYHGFALTHKNEEAGFAHLGAAVQQYRAWRNAMSYALAEEA